MNIYYFNWLLENENKFPSIIFSTRSDELLKKNEMYQFKIFNHAQLYFPSDWCIVEGSSDSLNSFKRESQSIYRNFDGIKIILPLNPDNIDVRLDKKMELTYQNCAHFIREYLVNAKILKNKEIKNYNVDDVYFELYSLGYSPDIETLKDWKHGYTKFYHNDISYNLINTFLVKKYNDDDNINQDLLNRMENSIIKKVHFTDYDNFIISCYNDKKEKILSFIGNVKTDVMNAYDNECNEIVIKKCCYKKVIEKVLSLLTVKLKEKKNKKEI